MTWDHAACKTAVENAADLTSVAREQSERSRDYYDHHQWTADEIAVLQRRKQPINVDNRIKRKIDAMLGWEQRMRTDPRAFPRHPRQAQMAEVGTKALVFVDDNTRFDAKRTAAFENLLIEGYGGAEVIVEEKRGQYEIAINRLRWEEIFFDPHSREKDFSDAAYVGCQKWMTVDSAVETFGPAWEGDEADLVELLETSMRSTQDGETWEDRPFHSNSFQWADRRQKRVRVAQMYYKAGGVWNLAIFCAGGPILNTQSPYLDEDGVPTNPIILMTAYIDRENNRYGVVEGLISLQDEINKRRSKLLHQLNSRQVMAVKGAVDSTAALKRELAAPDGVIEINTEAMEDAARVGVRPFEILPQNDQISGHFSLLAEAKAEIDEIGPDASLTGSEGKSQSGRAIQAQQQAGMAGIAPIYDSLRDWSLRIYRAVWERIRQYWTEERWIRVTDMQGGVDFMGLNVPQVDEFGQVVGIQNAIGEMDLDVIIDEAPDQITLQHEQFEQLAQMSQQGIPIPPEMLIEASSLTNKHELLQRMEQQQMQAMQAQQAQMQQEQQYKMAEAMAPVERDMAAAMKDSAGAEKIAAETQDLQVETAQKVVGLR